MEYANAMGNTLCHFEKRFMPLFGTVTEHHLMQCCALDILPGKRARLWSHVLDFFKD